MSKKRLIAIYNNTDLVDYAKENGYTLYDIVEDEFENDDNTITYRNEYYFEYTPELYLLLVRYKIDYQVYNFANLSNGQIANEIHYHALFSGFNIETIDVNESVEEEELDVIYVLELKNPSTGIIEYLKQNGYSYDASILCKEDEKRKCGIADKCLLVLYKINYVNKEFDEKGRKLIACLEGYTKKSANGKICIHKKINYYIRKLTS